MGGSEQRSARRGATAAAPGTLGTFAGVFTPSILTILGIILFLRTGYVVGAAGILRALLIVALANAISILTTISLSAIATNLRVKGGGDYYLISRTLGVRYGGALGLVLFLAQSVSIAFYAIGFGEALAAIFTAPPAWLPRAAAAAAVAALFVLAWLGADWATRFQYVVMAVLFAAIVVFFVGGIPAWDANLFRSNLSPSSELPFWVLFAIFFPAVTGFTQGVSMSGDLKDPGRSLPLGTFIAVGLSLVVYLGVTVVFAGTLQGLDLVNDYGAMRRVSPLPWLVDAGVIAATLSSALASFLGAPRILQSLASDRVFPLLNPFAAGHGPRGNPRRGVLLSTAIALVTIALGNLNLVAPVVSMFFLISYGLLNYATYVEARANSPFFRPRFRYFDKRLSLLGGLGCLGVMLAINPTAGVIAVVLLFGIHHYVAARVDVARWADSERSQLFQRVRDDLHAISDVLEHPRDWRPVLLALSDRPDECECLLRFAGWIEGGSGFTTALRLVPGGGTTVRRLRREAEQELQQEIDRHELRAFAKAVAAEDLASALPVVLQAHGLGRVRANTVLVQGLDGDGLADALRRVLRHGCNIVVLARRPEDFERIMATEPDQRVIDVWYRANATGRLTLMLAYLMTRTETWESARLRVFARSRGQQASQALEDLRRELDEARITAEAIVVEQADDAEIERRSRDSSMVFVPFRLGERGCESVFGERLDELTGALGATALVLAREDLQLDAEPESGRHAEIAATLDAARQAADSLTKAEQAVAQAEAALAERRQELEAAPAGDAGSGDRERLERGVGQAEQELERARRRLVKARLKAEELAGLAEKLTGKPAGGPV